MQIINKDEIKRRVMKAVNARQSIESNPYLPGSAAYDHWRTEYLAQAASLVWEAPMSKQSDAKEAQGYDPKPVPPTCSNCKSFLIDMALPAWMKQINNDALKAGRKELYGDSRKVGKNLSCAVGGFAVKKMSTCNEWRKI